jgi:hypothetical protein
MKNILFVIAVDVFFKSNICMLSFSFLTTIMVITEWIGDCRCLDSMVVGFTTRTVQSVPITTNVERLNPAYGEVFSDITLEDKVCQ